MPSASACLDPFSLGARVSWRDMASGKSAEVILNLGVLHQGAWVSSVLHEERNGCERPTGCCK